MSAADGLGPWETPVTWHAGRRVMTIEVGRSRRGVLVEDYTHPAKTVRVLFDGEAAESDVETWRVCNEIPGWLLP